MSLHRHVFYAYTRAIRMRAARVAAVVAMLACLIFSSGAVLPGECLACSQCECGSPTPPGYLLGGGAGQVSYGFEDRYLSKSNTLDDDPGTERQAEHRISGFLMYRPFDRLALQVRLPYAFKTNTREEEGAPHVITHSHGVADAEGLARFEAWRFGNMVSGRRTLAAILGGTAPTGSNDARDATGERLDAHMQPGTGAWSWTAGLAADASVQSAAVSASILSRRNGTSSRGYRYGRAVLLNLGFARALSPTWEAALELNGRDAARDRTEDGTEDPNSGGRLLYAAPSVRWSAVAPVTVELLVQIPVARDLNGNQTEKTTGRVALVWKAW